MSLRLLYAETCGLYNNIIIHMMSPKFYVATHEEIFREYVKTIFAAVLTYPTMSLIFIEALGETLREYASNAKKTNSENYKENGKLNGI